PWIHQTANLSNFDNNAVLFAVATQSGKTAIFIPKDSQNLKKQNLETVSPSVVQLLSNSLWSQAAIEFAKEMSAQAKANNLPIYLIIIIILIIVGAVVGLLYLLIFKKRRKSYKQKPKRLKTVSSI
ncbi:MAG: hypothetical protein LBT99_02985, partial [Bifidobacteriaceae bacterium]|nr:hypothetical protein [Bifidobacteriaceae bacterium]